MATDFKIKALQYQEFSKLFELNDKDLAEISIVRMKVDSFPGFPCRVSLEDAVIGEEVLLLPYEHHKTKSPYKGIGPIFVRKNATDSSPGVNEIPKMLIHRLLSLRAYDQSGMMRAAVVAEGTELKNQLIGLFDDKKVAYIHIHNAKPGCYNCVAERVKANH